MATPAWSPIPVGEALTAGRFWAGPEWRTERPSGTADWEILVTDRGCGRFVHRDGHLDCGPGRVILLRPGVPHDHGPAPGERLWQVAWVHFQARDSLSDLLEWPEPAPGLMVIDLPDASERQTLLGMIDEIRVVQHIKKRNRRRHAACLLELILLRLDACNPRAGAVRDPRVSAAVEILSRGGGRADAARAVGLSQSRLSHLFQRDMGMSLPAFREHLRLERAAQLLDSTQERVAAIAEACGYSDPFYFSNRFRAAKGMSPRAWRQRPNRHDDNLAEPRESGWSGERPKR